MNVKQQTNITLKDLVFLSVKKVIMVILQITLIQFVVNVVQSVQVVLVLK